MLPLAGLTLVCKNTVMATCFIITAEPKKGWCKTILFLITYSVFRYRSQFLSAR
jgi:hypothetical protein